MYSVGPTLDQQCQDNSWLSCVRPILGWQRQNNCWSSCVVPTLGRHHHNNCWKRYVGPIICRQRQPSTNCTNQSPTLAQHMNAILVCLVIIKVLPIQMYNEVIDGKHVSWPGSEVQYSDRSINNREYKNSWKYKICWRI